MAPMTRSGANHSLAAMREESWEFPSSDAQSYDSQEEVNGNGHSDDGDMSDVEDETMHKQPMTMDDVEEALYPLKRAVDRVGQQIEEFAQKLDQFKPQDAEETMLFKDACDVIREYQGIAQKTVKSLRTSHQSDSDSMKDFNVEDEASEIRSWEQEARTWDLLASVLSVDNPETQRRAQEADKIQDALHRYSTDGEKWNHFLATDPLAQELVAILTWLQRTADKSRDSIEDVVSKQLAPEGENDTVSSQALLYTKEAIKAQKRLRSWPQPLDPEDPGIDVSLTRASDKASLVTQLDPDAVSRQGRKLQDPDQMYDKASWIACWEMLRRGRSWSEIMEWSSERSEFWRAGTLKGANEEGDDPDGLLRLRNSRHHRLWQQMCTTITKNPTIDLYERAVYGLLGGITPNPRGICKDWSDELFVEFNAAVVRLYTAFLRSLGENHNHQDFNVADFRGGTDVSEAWIHDFIERLKWGEDTRKDARTPFNLVQGTIIAKLYEELFVSQGAALAAVAPKDSKLFLNATGWNHEEGAIAAYDNRNLVRIVTHIMLILQPLGMVRPSELELPLFENNLVAYISFLRDAGRLTLIPLYASRLSEERSIEVLSRVLIDVTEHHERQALVELMSKYGIDAAKVLQTQALNILHEVIEAESRDSGRYPSNTVLGPRQGKHRLADIRNRFMGEKITHNDELLIRSLEWHRCLEGHWDQVCRVANLFYERCFALGRLAAAREMCGRFDLQNVSKEVTGIDLSQSELSPEDIVDPKESSTKPTLLHDQARPWRELEQLSIALGSLEEWRDLVTQLESNLALRSSPPFKTSLKNGLKHCTAALIPLLRNPAFLLTAPTPQDLQSYHRIRLAYLPEIILAYNTVLVFAGHFVSRENLLACMNLAVSVGESEELTNVFVEAGRVRELVDGMAISSRALLSANEMGKGKRGFGGKRGQVERSEIWNVPLRGR